ncbi:protein ANTAGONIST OF LIKE HETEROCHROMATIN PROTEIN 1-like isoform X2 [Scleropages formosus]|nr:protein ANTAGONIST OF LIKE HETEROCHROMATIN PROTEIN 1-like isoform X2 [Scleropages formosus]
MLIARRVQCTCSDHTRTWTNTASTDWWERVAMQEFEPQDWLDKFRMSRDTFFYLCNKLRPRLARQDTHFRLALPVEKRVAVALWRLATNVEYRTISALFGVGRSTVCKCVRDVCHAIVGLLRPLYLRQPSEQELEDAARLFHRRWGFPHCMGAVDSLHIAIVAPSSNAASYWNSADWLSVVLQGVVNGLGQFWDVCAGFPGSTDDAAILQNSALWAAASEGSLSPQPPRPFMGRPLPYVLLGDEAYPLQSWLLKCYPESPELTPAQQVFNQQLSRARSVADSALLRLKARWQCLHKRNDCSLDLVPTMILTCCILHNVCEVHRDAFVDEWLEAVSDAKCSQPTSSVPALADDPTAEEVRSLFCDYFQQEHD